MTWAYTDYIKIWKGREKFDTNRTRFRRVGKNLIQIDLDLGWSRRVEIRYVVGMC